MIARKIRKLSKIVAPSAQEAVNQAQIDAAIAADNARDDATYLKLADAAGFLDRYNADRTQQLGLPQFGQLQLVGSIPTGTADLRSDISYGDWHPGTYLTPGNASSGNWKSDYIYSGQVEVTISGFGVNSQTGGGGGKRLIDAFYDHERIWSALQGLSQFPFAPQYSGNNGTILYPNSWPMGNSISPAPTPGVQLTSAQIAQVNENDISINGPAWGWYALNGTIQSLAGAGSLYNAGIRRLQLQVETGSGDNAFEPYHASNTDYNDQFAITNLNAATSPLQAKVGGFPVPNYTQKHNWLGGGNGLGSSAPNFYQVIETQIDDLYQSAQDIEHLQPYKGVFEYKFIHDLGATPSKLKFRLAPYTGVTDSWHNDSHFWCEVKPVDGLGQLENSF